MTCIVREYHLVQRPDYNERHRMMINSSSEKFIVYHHEYNWTNTRYGRCWTIIQLDEKYNLMEEQGHIRCYDNSLEIIVEHFPELWVKRFDEIFTGDGFSMCMRDAPKEVMGYFIKGDKSFTLSVKQLPKDKREIKSKVISRHSCKLQNSLDLNLFDESYGITYEKDSNITLEAYSNLDDKLWLHVHENCQKLL